MPRLKRINDGAKAASLRVRQVSKSVTYSDLTDADGSQSFDFDAALPANAQVIGYSIDTTEGFTDGAAGVFTADLGIKTTDPDAFMDGADIATIAKISTPFGVTPGGFWGGSTPQVTVLADVNVNTASDGALTAYINYIDLTRVD